ncbi:MAG: hypothetical protein V1743_07385 [Nanoarchaeota archaeon]
MPKAPLQENNDTVKDKDTQVKKPLKVKKLLQIPQVGRVLKTAVLTGALAAFASTAGAQDQTPTRWVDVHQEMPWHVTRVYAAGSLYKGIFEENPFMLNVSSGLNIFRTSPQSGMVLFPHVRIIERNNRKGFYWDNYVEGSIGVACTLPKFIISAEGAYRESYEQAGSDSLFFRVWGGFFDEYTTQPLLRSRHVPLSFGLSQIIEGEYNTITKNMTGDMRTEICLNLFKAYGLTLGPFCAGKFVYDREGIPWNRYSQGSVGGKLRAGPLTLLVEHGYREPLKTPGGGQYDAVTIAFWSAL